jgi:hypothetical protein
MLFKRDICREYIRKFGKQRRHRHQGASRPDQPVSP